MMTARSAANNPKAALRDNLRRTEKRMNDRFRFLDVHPIHPQETLCSVVAAGLEQRPKQLPCRFFYDTVGSHIFEQICALPEYYLTRTEQAIITRYADQMIEAV